jgi:hypothetical protein
MNRPVLSVSYFYTYEHIPSALKVGTGFFFGGGGDLPLDWFLGARLLQPSLVIYYGTYIDVLLLLSSRI